MSDVQKCDACGSIRHRHESSYKLESHVSRIESSREAYDITSEGHLCTECAFKVAETIAGLGE